MSFLVNALGAVAAPLLKEAGGYLLDKGKSYLGKITNYFSGSLGGENNPLGKTAMSRMYNQADNALGGFKKFAQSDYLKRKMPILAPVASNAADFMRERLSRGYNQMMGGGGKDGGGGGAAFDGIERMQQ